MTRNGENGARFQKLLDELQRAALDQVELDRRKQEILDDFKSETKRRRKVFDQQQQGQH